MKPSVKTFFTAEEEQVILSAIKLAEKDSSGEIRVHLENTTHRMSALRRAAQVFKRIKMHKTKERNGVLFYIAVCDRKFAIVGDKGIDTKVPDNYWESIKDDMQTAFAHGDYATAIADAICKTGKLLSRYFPYTSDDVNELPDEISYDE